eukprot:747920-Hanusia_phi.AAC.1
MSHSGALDFPGSLKDLYLKYHPTETLIFMGKSGVVGALTAHINSPGPIYGGTRPRVRGMS